MLLSLIVCLLCVGVGRGSICLSYSPCIHVRACMSLYDGEEITHTHTGGERECVYFPPGCFTSTKTVGLLGTGTHDGHLDFLCFPREVLLLNVHGDEKAC